MARHSCQANAESEFLKLSMNLPRTPIVLACQLTNERPQLLRDRRPSGAALRDPSPVKPEPLAMPPDHRVGFDDHEDFLPARPGSGEKGPEHPIHGSDPRFWTSLDVGGKLLAQSKLNECLLVPASEEGWNASKEGRREFEQMPHSEEHSAWDDRSIRD